MKKKFTALIAAAVLAASGCADLPAMNSAATDEPRSAPAAERTVSSEIRDTEFAFKIQTPVPTAAADQNAGIIYTALDMDALRQSIESEITQSDGVWSVYVKDMNVGKDILINDVPMKAASVMKLFVMGAAFDNIKTGLFEYGDLSEDMYYMITESSNESANAILYTLGGGSYANGIYKVNAFTDKYGYNEKTVEYNGFDNPDTIVGGSFNVTSAHDCGMMLEAIYNGKCVSAEMSWQMLELLKEQRTDYKLVYELPEQTVVANKSGEMDEVENDVGIVFSPGRDYIICVLSNDWSNNANAIETIQKISRTTYDFFNPENPDDGNYVMVTVGPSGETEEYKISDAEETPEVEIVVEAEDTRTGETTGVIVSDAAE